jgi:hypothetical protein
MFDTDYLAQEWMTWSRTATVAELTEASANHPSAIARGEATRELASRDANA